MRVLPAISPALLALALATMLPPGPTSASSPDLTTDHFQFFVHGDQGKEAAEGIAEVAEGLVDRVESFTGSSIGVDVLRVHTYATIEAKGLATGYMQPTHSLSGRGELYVALEDGFNGVFEYELALLLVRRALGKPRLDALESGLGTWLGPARETSLYWAGRIAEADSQDALDVLLDNRAWRAESYLVTRVLSCALVEHLVETWGRESFVERYVKWPGVRGEVERFGPFLSLLSRREDPRKQATRRPPPSFHRGFCYAHEGYNIDDGYGSNRSDRALEKLASLGTNAVSITPFTYMRRADHPAPLPFSNGTRSENDESVVHAARTAHDLDMIVMLKPHVWLTGSWPGAIEMKSEADWNLFFEYYYKWIRHYALLASMHDIDILCIGTELSAATTGHEAGWEEIIEKLRVIYDGKLTYAANWGSEFETVSFWPSLDFIGVNCYYPLSGESEPSDEQLEEGVSRALSGIEAVAQRYGKPALITEVGFASAPAPWTAPHERRRGVVVDESAQARCYERFFRGLVGRSDIVGVYWWKWPSFLGYGGPRHAGFTPNGKQAESVVRRWYGGVESGPR